MPKAKSLDRIELTKKKMQALTADIERREAEARKPQLADTQEAENNE